MFLMIFFFNIASAMPIELAEPPVGPPLTRLSQLPEVIAPRYGVHEYTCKGNGCPGVQNVVCTRREWKWRCEVNYKKHVILPLKPSVTCTGNQDGKVVCHVHVWATYQKMTVGESFFVVASLLLIVSVLGPFALLALLIPTGTTTETSIFNDC